MVKITSASYSYMYIVSMVAVLAILVIFTLKADPAKGSEAEVWTCLSVENYMH